MTLKPILSLVAPALTVVFAIYGCFHFVYEMFTTFIPLGVLITATLVFAVYFFRAHQPDLNVVEAVLGKGNTIAHRGAGLDAPENTLQAFDLCHAGGCDFIEFDVQLTSDKVPIVFHDTDVERLSDTNLVVKRTTYEVLKNVDISIKHPLRQRFGFTNIPTLEQTIIKLLSNGQKMIIDLKDNNTQLISIILEVYCKYPDLYSKAIVSSFYPNLIYRIRKSDPIIVCSLAYRPHIFANEYYKYPEGRGPERATEFWKKYLLKTIDIFHCWALGRFTYYFIGISVILLHKDCLSAESIVQWRDKGVRVISWTVNSPIEKQHTAKNLKITYLTDTLTGELSAHSSNS